MRKLIDFGWCVGILNMQTNVHTLTISSASDADEHAYHPAESVTVCGKPSIIALRDALNEAYPKEPGK